MTATAGWAGGGCNALLNLDYEINLPSTRAAASLRNGRERKTQAPNGMYISAPKLHVPVVQRLMFCLESERRSGGRQDHSFLFLLLYFALLCFALFCSPLLVLLLYSALLNTAPPMLLLPMFLLLLFQICVCSLAAQLSITRECGPTWLWHRQEMRQRGR